MIFIFMSYLFNDICTLILIQNPGFHKLSFPTLVSKILQCDTWYSYTPLQYHVLYTLPGRGVTHIFSISCNCATLLDFVPFIEPTQSTPNVVSIYQPCTHTQLNAMSTCICNEKMPLHVISCYMYNEHYLEQFITRTMDNYIESI